MSHRSCAERIRQLELELAHRPTVAQYDALTTRFDRLREKHRDAIERLDAKEQELRQARAYWHRQVDALKARIKLIKRRREEAAMEMAS